MESILYFGDNLGILRHHIRDDSVDLIYLDPPFNSKKNYNYFFSECDKTKSAAQIKAFKDTWTWDQSAAKTFQEVVEIGGNASKALQAFRQLFGPCNMLAYLTMMTPRLLEMHRVLKKDKGSIYLHCDPTASHYLKLLMDAVFGPKNFRNEIVWCYRGGGVPKKDFARRHNIILRYSKTNDYYFDVDAVRTRYSKDSVERLKYKARSFRRNGVYDNYKPNPLGKHPEDWWAIQPLMPSDKERTGYPTQKPERLLKRIIKASSKIDDIILDPFCGCGTTIAAAQQLGRRWIGIDITPLAINIIKKRLGTSISFKTIYEPVTLPDAKALAQHDRYNFQKWALGRVDVRLDDVRKGPDHGIDGILYFHDNPKGETKSVIISVKSGRVHVNHVRELRGVVEREGAQIGALITLETPTQQMKTEAASSGYYNSPAGTKHEKIQILAIEDLLRSKSIDLPKNGNHKNGNHAGN